MIMRKNSARQGMILGVLAQVLQVGVGLFMMPLALYKLSSAEIGLWYVFLTVQSLVLLLDFGFTQTFSRSFAYLFAGATRLLSEGVQHGSGKAPDPDLLAAAIIAARRLYLMVGGAALIALLSAGSWYVLNVASDARLEIKTAGWAWLLFVAGVFLNIYMQWQNSLLAGANLVADNYKITIASRLVQLVLSLVGLWICSSLLALSLAYLVSIIVFRIYGGFLIRIRLPITKAGDFSRSPQTPQELFRTLLPNAARLGLVSLGAFLITRFIFFAIASFQGLAISAQYAVAFQALIMIQGVAQVVFSLRLPQIAGARVHGDVKEMKRLFLQSIGFSWLVIITMGIGLVSCGPTVLSVIHSQTPLPSSGVLVLMLVVWFLETNHANCATLIVMSNRVPFVKAALYSGAGVVAGILLAGRLGCSLLAFVAVQGIVQMLYNNWKWPLQVANEIQLKPGDVAVMLKKEFWR